MMVPHLPTLALSAAFFSSFFWMIILFPDIFTKKSSKRYGFLFLLSTLGVLFFIFARTHSMQSILLVWFPLYVLLSLSMFPLAYLFVHTVMRRGTLYKHHYLIHFTIPLLFSIFFSLSLNYKLGHIESLSFLNDHINNAGIVTRPYNWISWLHWLGKLFYLIQIVYYSYAILKDYRSHILTNKKLRYNARETDFSWFNKVAFLFIVVFIVHISQQLSQGIFPNLHAHMETLSYLSFAFLTFFTGYYITSQQDLYNQSDMEDFPPSIIQPKQVSKEEITDYLEGSKPYLNPDFSLYEMATFFHINRTRLSNIINNEYQHNFRRLVNKYRLEEATRFITQEIQETGQVSLEYVAAKSGYNTYITFSRVFKAEIGISPKAYCVEQKKQHYSPRNVIVF